MKFFELSRFNDHLLPWMLIIFRIGHLSLIMWPISSYQKFKKIKNSGLSTGHYGWFSIIWEA